ncbi:MAG: nitroreductase family deazaflavin-dependent oxidoreductase [Actinobacteria bacterium]|nr:nitroreductase family deazaflavin-dependent oxidoreductase [Actinomycetota bacterium]
MTVRHHRLLHAYWKVLNPITRPLAGLMPWWVVLETTGRRTGRMRRTPLANGPFDGSSIVLLSVHGDRSAFARNIADAPHVRVKRRGRWHSGTASVVEPDDATLRRFSGYARLGYRTVGDNPKFIRVELDGVASASR